VAEGFDCLGGRRPDGGVDLVFVLVGPACPGKDGDGAAVAAGRRDDADLVADDAEQAPALGGDLNAGAREASAG
jgi:hypothetical protein